MEENEGEKTQTRGKLLLWKKKLKKECPHIRAKFRKVTK